MFLACLCVVFRFILCLCVFSFFRCVLCVLSEFDVMFANRTSVRTQTFEKMASVKWI